MNEGIVIGVTDIGVNDIGVIVKLVSADTAPPEPNSVQLRSLQQPGTPLRITQWRPAWQDPPSLQHSPPSGAQLKAPQHLKLASQAPPLAQQVWPVVTQDPSSQHRTLPVLGQHLWETLSYCQRGLALGFVWRLTITQPIARVTS